MLSKGFKKKIAVLSLSFFLGTSFDFSFTDTAEAAPRAPLPQPQVQVKSPPRRAASRPAAPPRAVKRPSTAKPAVRPRQNVKPAQRPAVKKQPARPGSVKPPRGSGQNVRPAVSHKDNVNKPAVSQQNKRPAVRPRPDNNKIKPSVSHKDNIGKKPAPNDKKPILRPNGDKIKPPADKNKPSRPGHDKKKPVSRPHHDFKLHDRVVPAPPPPPRVHHRTPRWLLFGGFAYAAYPRTIVNQVVVDYSYLSTAGDVYLDNFVKTKYIEGEYDGQDYYADYYIDKNSLEAVQYNPPDYIIRVNEVSFDNMDDDNNEPYITTWEFKYNLDYRTVYFRNIYDTYQTDPEDWTFLNVYNDEYYVLPTAEMAFYLVYNYRFFDNQPDSFYDVETL